MQHLTVHGAPESLIIDPEIFGVGYKGVVLSNRVQDKVTTKGGDGKSNQPHSEPEQARMGHGIGRRIQPICQDRETLAPGRVNHLQPLSQQGSVQAHRTEGCEPLDYLIYDFQV